VFSDFAAPLQEISWLNAVAQHCCNGGILKNIFKQFSTHLQLMASSVLTPQLQMLRCPKHGTD